MRPSAISRRAFMKTGLRTCATATLLAPTGLAHARPVFGAPAIVQSEASRPAVPEGVAAGDVTVGRAVIWSRTDRPSRLIVEYSTTEKFQNVLRRVGPAALDSTDFTARIVLTDLPADQRIFYRVLFEDLADLRTTSVPHVGSFRTPPVTSP